MSVRELTHSFVDNTELQTLILGLLSTLNEFAALFDQLDERINAGIEAYREALQANGKDFTFHVYDGVNHAFNNDTSMARYDKPAADLAWSRTIAFFREKLA